MIMGAQSSNSVARGSGSRVADILRPAGFWLGLRLQYLRTWWYERQPLCLSASCRVAPARSGRMWVALLLVLISACGGETTSPTGQSSQGGGSAGQSNMSQGGGGSATGGQTGAGGSNIAGTSSTGDGSIPVGNSCSLDAQCESSICYVTNTGGICSPFAGTRCSDSSACDCIGFCTKQCHADSDCPTGWVCPTDTGAGTCLQSCDPADSTACLNGTACVTRNVGGRSLSSCYQVVN